MPRQLERRPVRIRRSMLVGLHIVDVQHCQLSSCLRRQLAHVRVSGLGNRVHDAEFSFCRDLKGMLLGQCPQAMLASMSSGDDLGSLCGDRLLLGRRRMQALPRASDDWCWHGLRMSPQLTNLHDNIVTRTVHRRLYRWNVQIRKALMGVCVLIFVPSTFDPAAAEQRRLLLPSPSYPPPLCPHLLLIRGPSHPRLPRGPLK